MRPYPHPLSSDLLRPPEVRCEWGVWGPGKWVGVSLWFHLKPIMVMTHTLAYVMMHMYNSGSTMISKWDTFWFKNWRSFFDGGEPSSKSLKSPAAIFQAQQTAYAKCVPIKAVNYCSVNCPLNCLFSSSALSSFMSVFGCSLAAQNLKCFSWLNMNTTTDQTDENTTTVHYPAIPPAMNRALVLIIVIIVFITMTSLGCTMEVSKIKVTSAVNSSIWTSNTSRIQNFEFQMKCKVFFAPLSSSLVRFVLSLS